MDIDELSEAALALIGAPYANVKAIRNGKLEGIAKLVCLRERSVPAAAPFFAWCRERRARPDLLSRSPLAKVLKYALDREAGLSLHLSDADVAIDTNHVERGCGRSRPDSATGCSPGQNRRGARRRGPRSARDLHSAGRGVRTRT